MNMCEQLALIAQTAHDEFQTFIMYVALYALIGFGVFFCSAVVAEMFQGLC